MQISLRSSAKKWTAAATLVAAASGYCAIAATRLLADHFAQADDGASLGRALRLDPGNAEYHYQLGLRELSLQFPGRAIPWLEAATRLNPDSSKYWIDLAAAHQLLGDSEQERESLDRALAVDPRTPETAWQAANFFLAAGLTDAAMQQFHTVLENDAPLTWPAITTAWKIRPDVDALLQSVVPPAANIPFLQFLVSRNESEAAEKVWRKIFELQQPVERADLLGYEHFLLTHQQVEQAVLVWQQAARVADLAAYQPSAENLLVNGDFSLEILNGGFDWAHESQRGVGIALDPTETHSGSRSLRITLDGDGISDAGITQLVNVEPNTHYDFTAFYKAKDMDGAGAMQFAIHDAYKATPLFASEDLRDADFWKNAGGSFLTPAETHLIIVHVVRVPAGRPIRGKLWIDGLRLVQGGTESR